MTDASRKQAADIVDAVRAGRDSKSPGDPEAEKGGTNLVGAAQLSLDVAAGQDIEVDLVVIQRNSAHR